MSSELLSRIMSAREVESPALQDLRGTLLHQLWLMCFKANRATWAADSDKNNRGTSEVPNCYTFGNKWLARQLGISERMVEKNNKKLEVLGLIIKWKRHAKHLNTVWVIAIPEPEPESLTRTQVRVKEQPLPELESPLTRTREPFDPNSVSEYQVPRDKQQEERAAITPREVFDYIVQDLPIEKRPSCGPNYEGPLSRLLLRRAFDPELLRQAVAREVNPAYAGSDFHKFLERATATPDTMQHFDSRSLLGCGDCVNGQVQNSEADTVSPCPTCRPEQAENLKRQQSAPDFHAGAVPPPQDFKEIFRSSIDK